MTIFQFSVSLWTIVLGHDVKLFRNFTVYDFVNRKKSGDENEEIIAVREEKDFKTQTTRDLSFPVEVLEVFKFYYTRVRKHWVAFAADDELNVNLTCVDEGNDQHPYVHRTQRFFVNCKGM